MASLYDSASLVYIPSAVKDTKAYSIKPTDGSGDFTFSRGSDIQATRVNSSGLIEKAKVNLLTYSEDFSNAAWTKVNATLTSGQSGYDGSSDAWKWAATTGTTTQLSQGVSGSSLNTISFYAKAGTISIVSIWVGSGVDFDLSAGTTAGSANASIESVGNGWYRCSYFGVYQILNPYFTASSAGEFVYIQDSQINYGLIAQDYVETTTTAVVEGLTADLPRLDYSGGASCPSLLLEPSRTNAFANSEYFGAWSLSRTSAFGSGSILNDTTSPEGVVNAAYIQQATGQTSAGGVFITALFATGTYTMSVFAKAKEQRYVRLGGAFAASGASIWCNFDLQEGVAGTPDSGITPKIDNYGNGWYRCSITATKVDTTGQNVFIYQANSSSGPDSTALDGLYIYGAMLESSATYPTSYIPTYGTAANRGADACSKTGISSVFGTNQGTLFFEGTYGNEANEIYLFAQNSLGSTTTDSIYLQRSGASSVQTQVWNGTTQEAVIVGGSLSIGDTFKVAVGFANNDVVLYLNGVQIGTDTSVTIPTLTALQIGKYPASAGDNYRASKPVKQSLVFPTRLTNAELAALTA